MAKLTDPPPSRAFNVRRDGPPKNGKALTKTGSAALVGLVPARAGAGESAVTNGGTGLSGAALDMIRREMQPIALQELYEPALGFDQAPESEERDNRVWTGSAAAIDFLRFHVLPTNEIVPFAASGFVTFDRELGVHAIPLSVNEGPNIGNASTMQLPGDFILAAGQALIITEFRPFAGIVNPGLPGAHVMIDPLSLVGQVVFYAVVDNGRHALAESTVVAGQPEPGGAIVNDNADVQYPAFTDTAQQSIQGAYRVCHQPFPGYPSIVGVRLRGYTVSQELLVEALERSRRAGE